MGKLLFKNISKAYGNGFCAVNKFNLEIQDGEFIVLVGPSGCGKSTILRMIAGLEKISDGELILDDKVINKCPPVERDIAVVFQDYALYGNMSVYDNVGMSMRVRHEKDTVIYDKVKEASGILGIGSLLKRLPGQLSGGQKQRVALARSVVRRPKVFLMDEPLSNLDAKLRTSTRAEIVRLQRELKVTTVYVTHDQTEAMTMADRMVVLKDGIIQQAGTPKEIYYEPCNLFVAGFIGAPQMNFIEGKVEGSQFVFDSHSLLLPQRIADPLKQYSGSELILGIRPEHFSISNGENKNVFTGELENKEFLGSSYILYVRIGESVLTCQVESTEDCFDRQVNVHFGMEHIYFFDKKTTQLVMHAKAGENDE
ncbi:ABC transporter ATP-binding protein [Lacrimispora defluvii]|uniref:ABC transporter ATP-binding protein n=1 Tax=Lacrimispora defluvii TaxID=2719233 RepID=A0ABX1VUE5_9FIRM|nr:ABC transporter ATP-binding protein [Lacrimispora defluvii]NNJ30995.1 ABC transporter ATP-binding protein [Lacrimispora defluvii]